MPRPKAYVTPSRRGTTTITEVEVGSPANVLLKLRESTSAVDLSKLDKYGLEPELSQRVASFADDFNAGHADDSLVRSLLRQYAAAASQVCGDAAATTELAGRDSARRRPFEARQATPPIVLRAAAAGLARGDAAQLVKINRLTEKGDRHSTRRPSCCT